MRPTQLIVEHDLIHRSIISLGLTTLPSSRLGVVEIDAEALKASVASAVTPDTIYSTYSSSGDSTGSHGSKLGSQAVVEFGNFANFNEDDTQTFFETYQSNLLGEVSALRPDCDIALTRAHLNRL